MCNVVRRVAKGACGWVQSRSEGWTIQNGSKRSDGEGRGGAPGWGVVGWRQAASNHLRGSTRLGSQLRGGLRQRRPGDGDGSDVDVGSWSTRWKRSASGHDGSGAFECLLFCGFSGVCNRPAYAKHLAASFAFGFSSAGTW